MKMIWLSKSPNPNAIEPTWFWIKRQTTKHGAALSVVQMEKDWIDCLG